MTKSRDHKHAVRAYMAEHGVNYTTAQRALAAAKSTPAASIAADPVRNPDPWNLTAALVSLATDELVMAEHTSEPESPVPAEMLRLAVHAAGTHGPHHGGPTWFPDAIAVCRSAVLALEVTADLNAAPDARPDGQYPVDPADLSGVLSSLADDEMSLREHAEECGVEAEDLFEVLTWLADGLDKPHDPYTDLTERQREHVIGTVAHVLIVEPEPLGNTDDMDAEDILGFRITPYRDYSIECPGLKAGRCQGWEECNTCFLLSVEDREKFEQTGISHGVEHQYMPFGLSAATGQCSLQSYPEAWVDSVSDLDLPAGRYQIDFGWDESCDITLVTATIPATPSAASQPDPIIRGVNDDVCLHCPKHRYEHQEADHAFISEEQ